MPESGCAGPRRSLNVLWLWLAVVSHHDGMVLVMMMTTTTAGTELRGHRTLVARVSTQCCREIKRKTTHPPRPVEQCVPEIRFLGIDFGRF
eukprot:2439871-Rhodomonas_salina.2